MIIGILCAKNWSSVQADLSYEKKQGDTLTHSTLNVVMISS